MTYLSTDHRLHGGLKLQWFLCPNYCQEEVNIHSAESNITVLDRCSSQSEQSFSVASNSQWVDAIVERLSSLLHSLEENESVHTLVTQSRLTQQLCLRTLNSQLSQRDWEIEWKQHLVVCSNFHAMNTLPLGPVLGASMISMVSQNSEPWGSGVSSLQDIT